MKKLVIVCVAIGILLSITSVAHAVATSNNKAVLYWNTFSYSYTGTVLTWLNTESKSLAAADDKNSIPVFDDDFSVGCVDTSATSSVPNAWATSLD